LPLHRERTYGENRRRNVKNPSEVLESIRERRPQGEENTELVVALRHCDGEHIQAVVLVRDDFWLAASRFMRELEIRASAH
jgi:hypothetical protein